MTQTEREAWLAERKQGIGGSEAAAIMGLSPWSTPVTIWLDKTGRSGPQEETEAMRIGTELEDFVARRYSQETGRQVQRFNKMVHRGCLLGNFDRLVVKEGEKVASHMGEVRTDLLLECKTSSREWDDGVPLYYQTQVQHYMGLEPNLKSADVACLFLGRKHFEIYRVERDQAVIDHMQRFITEWWDKHVLHDEMPSPTSEADCKLLWARSNPGKTVQGTETIKLELRHIAQLKYEAKWTAEEASEMQSLIEARMGDAEIIADPVSGEPWCTWKSTKDSKKVDWKAIAEEVAMGQISPELIAKHTSVVPGSRRFIIKVKKASDED